MVGAAMGTAISIFLFNFFIVTILYYFYRINPFHYKSFFAIIVAVIVAFFALRIDLGNPYFNILIKSLFTTITYVLLIYYLKISPDINGLIVKYFHIAKSWLKG